MAWNTSDIPPQAGRTAIVTGANTGIGYETALALAAKNIFSKSTGKAAANLSTSRMIDDIAEKTGGQVIRTAVGEANVARGIVDNGNAESMIPKMPDMREE